MIRPVSIYPDPCLVEPAPHIETFDEDIKSLARDLIDTMYSYDAAGIAAPQIGVSLAVFVINGVIVDNKRDPLADPVVFVNPTLTGWSDDSESGVEGCLSFPKGFTYVTRPLSCHVSAYDTNGSCFTVSASGFYSRAIQHEYDHLCGTLMSDRASDLNRKILLKKHLRAK